MWGKYNFQYFPFSHRPTWVHWAVLGHFSEKTNLVSNDLHDERFCHKLVQQLFNLIIVKSGKTSGLVPFGSSIFCLVQSTLRSSSAMFVIGCFHINFVSLIVYWWFTFWCVGLRVLGLPVRVPLFLSIIGIRISIIITPHKKGKVAPRGVRMQGAQPHVQCSFLPFAYTLCLVWPSVAK